MCDMKWAQHTVRRLSRSTAAQSCHATCRHMLHSTHAAFHTLVPPATSHQPPSSYLGCWCFLKGCRGAMCRLWACCNGMLHNLAKADAIWQRVVNKGSGSCIWPVDFHYIASHIWLTVAAAVAQRQQANWACSLLATLDTSRQNGFNSLRLIVTHWVQWCHTLALARRHSAARHSLQLLNRRGCWHIVLEACHTW